MHNVLRQAAKLTLSPLRIRDYGKPFWHGHASWVGRDGDHRLSVPSIVESRKAARPNLPQEASSATPMTADFDTIIIGGGAAGCVLANRLSARSAQRVL